MRLIHLSDLHLGKRANEFSLVEDQRYILEKIIEIVDEEKPDGVIIAGDVYDKAVPSAEAVQMFDEFLYKLSSRNIDIYIISGNHDSPERIAFAGKIMEKNRIYISPAYNGEILPIKIEDDYGIVNIYLLPFIKPAHIRRYYPDKCIETYTDAVGEAIKEMKPDFSERNILVTHQFVTGAERSDSEEISVGGSDNVDMSVFEGFDYVALGHIHRPQNIITERIRYCGTPLKYSFSEANHEKTVTVVDLGKKGELSISERKLVPLRDMREIKGTYEEITYKKYYDGTGLQDDYVHITLTDEDDITDAVGKLRIIYRGLMKLDYDNKRTRSSVEITGIDIMKTKSPLELFDDFYLLQNGSPMSEEQKTVISEMIEEIWEDKI